MQSGRKYIYFAVVLGVAALLLAAIGGANTNLHGTVSIVIIILDVLALVVALFAGRAAKRSGGRPLWKGALMGAIYGFLFSIGSFFVTITPAEFEQQMQKAGQTVSSAQVAQAVSIGNSPLVHVLGIVASLIMYGVLGLIAGLIGGVTTRREGERDAV